MGTIVKLDAEFWAALEAEAEARVARWAGNSYHQRGERQLDCCRIGVAGEWIVERAMPSAEHRHRDDTGEPTDVVLAGHSFDIKCCWLVPNHRWFLVNDFDHERRKAAGIEYYLPVVTLPNAPAGVVGRAIPLSDVDCWEVTNPRFEAARGLELEVAALVYFDAPLCRLRHMVQADEGMGDGN